MSPAFYQIGFWIASFSFFATLIGNGVIKRRFAEFRGLCSELESRYESEMRSKRAEVAKLQARLNDAEQDLHMKNFQLRLIDEVQHPCANSQTHIDAQVGNQCGVDCGYTQKR